MLGRRLQKKSEHALRYALAAFAIALWLAYNIWWNSRGIDWRGGLPLQLCDSTGSLRRSRSSPAGASPRHALFLDCGADRAGLDSAGADRRPGLRAVLGILDCAHRHRRLRGLRCRGARLSPALARSRHRGARERRLSGADPDDRSLAGADYGFVVIGVRRYHRAVRRRTRPLAAARDRFGGAGADRICPRAAAVGGGEEA